jgi:hypothetical protein
LHESEKQSVVILNVIMLPLQYAFLSDFERVCKLSFSGISWKV